MMTKMPGADTIGTRCGRYRMEYLAENPRLVHSFWNDAEFHERLYRASYVVFSLLAFAGFAHG